MPAKNGLFLRMAKDIGVKKYKGESDEGFSRRTAYTASRYWTSAFCMDDGSGGDSGLSRQALNRKLRSWIGRLDNAQPGMSEWFEVDQGNVSCIYNRLIDVGELKEDGFSNRFRAQPPKLAVVGMGQALIVGMFDPTNTSEAVLGYRRPDIVATGLASIVASDLEAPAQNPRWWETEWELLAWARASDFGSVEYANPATRAWGLRNGEVWSPDFRPTKGIALARTTSNDRGGTTYYAARPVGGKPFLCSVEQTKALELYYHLKEIAGNPVVARLRRIDDQHVELAMPLGLIPGEYDRVLEVASWPVRNVYDRFDRLMRAECVPMARDLLSKCGVVLKEA